MTAQETKPTNASSSKSGHARPAPCLRGMSRVETEEMQGER